MHIPTSYTIFITNYRYTKYTQQALATVKSEKKTISTTQI